jgi:DNA gyrase subunit A
MDVVRNKEEFMLTVSENGYGKLTEIKEFTLQNRGGSGIFAARVNSKTGKLQSARLLDHPKKELLMLSANGLAVKIETDNLPIQSRQTAGVRLMKLRTGDTVAAIAVV